MPSIHHRSDLPNLLACILALCIPAAVVTAQTGVADAAAPAKPLTTLKIHGEDEREQVGDTAQFPWSAIGLVEAVWHAGGQTIILTTGTGVLIGSDVVLTAGHCIYDQNFGWADQVLFVPGKNGGSEPFGRSYSVRTISQSAWVDQGDHRYDVAIIVLAEPLGERAGIMNVSVQTESFFMGRNLNTAGYPGEAKPGDVQYHSFGTAMDVQDKLIRHTMDSEPGQSGSPIWYYDPETQTRSVVGVLTGSREVNTERGPIDAYNVGVHIDPYIGSWIDDALATYEGTAQSVDFASTEVAGRVAPAACGAGVPMAAAAFALAFAPLLFIGRRRRTVA